jgi:hypothetical protein
MGWKESPFSPANIHHGKGDGQVAHLNAVDNREKAPRQPVCDSPDSDLDAWETRNGGCLLGSFRSGQYGVSERALSYREAVSFNYSCASRCLIGECCRRTR